MRPATGIVEGLVSLLPGILLRSGRQFGLARKKQRAKSIKLAGKPDFPVLEAPAPEPLEADDDVSRAEMRLARSRLAAERVQAAERQRLAAAAAREPIDFRARHRALEGESGAALERFARQIPDAEGRPGNPHRTYDTLAALFRNGSIGAEELDAGRQFEEDFRLAQLNPLHAPNLTRISGTRGPGVTDAMVAGRHKVARVMAALGGFGSPPGAALWAVLGMGGTIKEFARSSQACAGRSLDEKVAKGIFVAALGVLAAHYGLVRR